MRIEGNVVRESFEEQEVEDSEQQHYSVVKGKCVLVLVPVTLLITIAYALH
jgi:hypothetical protein